MTKNGHLRCSEDFNPNKWPTELAAALGVEPKELRAERTREEG